jgi:hypothetical protein
VLGRHVVNGAVEALRGAPDAQRQVVVQIPVLQFIWAAALHLQNATNGSFDCWGIPKPGCTAAQIKFGYFFGGDQFLSKMHFFVELIEGKYFFYHFRKYGILKSSIVI